MWVGTAAWELLSVTFVLDDNGISISLHALEACQISSIKFCKLFLPAKGGTIAINSA